MPKKIEISHRTIIFTIAFLVFLWLLYHVIDLIFALFVAFLIMSILNPFVTKFQKYKIPRAFSVLVSYLLFFVLVGGAIAAVVPPLIEQSTSFANGLPGYLENIGIPSYVGDQLTNQLLSQLGALPAQAARFVVSIFSNLLAVVTVLFFAFYMLLARDKLDDQITYFFGDKNKKKVGGTFDKLEDKLGGWARGQITLMILVGVFNYVGLTLLGIPYALPLAILAGLLEIIPYIGPIFAAVPAVIIGFGISPLIGLATAALAFLIQQLENYVFVPKVMEKSAGVSPIITLLALSIGFRFAGVIGVIISVPLVITTQVLLKEYVLASK